MAVAFSAFAAVALPTALYLRTMAPTLYNIDSAELATAAKTGGIPHPPGYPLYILIAHGFASIPLGDVGYRVNMMSAACAALALFFLFCIVLRITKQPLAAVAAAWTLGLSYPFWSDSVVAEVYTLDAALVAGMVFFLLRWKDEDRIADIVVAFVLFGLSLTNRTTNLMALPAIVVFIAPKFMQQRDERPRLLGASLAALPPLALYAILPLRSLQDAGYRWGSSYTLTGARRPIDLTDPQQLWWYISARIFRPLATLYGWTDRVRETFVFIGDFWTALLGGGVIFALIGAGWLLMRQQRVAVLLLLIAVPQTLFFINYAAPDKNTMFLTTYLIAAIFVGCGVARAVDVVRENVDIRREYWIGAGSVAALAVWGLLLVHANFGLVDVSGDYRAHRDAESLFATAEPNSMIVGRWTDIAPLEYVQTVEHKREDLALVHEYVMSADALKELAEYNVTRGRTVYVFRREDVFEDEFGFNPVGDWFKLTPGEEFVAEEVQ